MKPYIAAAGVAFAGFIGAVALVAGAYLSLDETTRFLAPGAGSIEAKRPGAYLVWHEHRTTFENRDYRSEPGLPAGARFTVRGPDGPPLPIASAGSQSWKGSDMERLGVGRFEAPVAGRYTVVLDGPFQPIVIAVTPDYVGRMVWSVGGAVLLALLGFGVGLGLFVRAIGASESAAATAAPMAGVESAPRDADKDLRDMATLVYALYAVSFLMGITLIGGVVVAYLKRDDAAGSWLESHYRWQIRTFWWALLWGAIGAVTSLILVGFAVLFAAAVWFIYRVAKGWLALGAGKPVGRDQAAS